METINEDFKTQVLNLSVNGIYVYDVKKGLNVYINQQYTNLTGYTLEDLNSMSQENFLALFHEGERDLVLQHMEEVIESNLGEVIEMEYRFRRADGSWMWCLSRDSLFRLDRENGILQFIGSFVDITDKKNLENRLRETNKELEHFVHIASHDLREQ